jgi:vitamin B12 transporter
MTYLKTPLRGSHRSALALLALIVPSPAEETPPDDEIIVSALRIPRESSSVTSFATLLDPTELTNQGIPDLRTALNFSPGVISTSTGGQTGAAGSLFIRGTNTGYSVMVVDGFRISDSTTPLGNALAGARIHDLGRLEILRGPQGAIHGGESVGGVLWLETPRGSGDASGSVTLEAGSFGTISGHTRFEGSIGDLSYFVSGGYEETENDGDLQHFHQGTSAIRLEGKAAPGWTIGMTFRGTDSYYENSGSSDDHLDAALATVHAVGEISDRWTARFLAGYHQEFYDSDSSFGNYGTDLRAGGVSTHHEIKLAENVRLLAGAFFHETSFENTIGTDESRDRFGVHTALEWDAIQNLTLSGAIRWEDYDEFSDQTTWRFGAVYTVENTGTTFRGGYGTSFRSPAFIDLFGSSFGPGNPDLDPESSRGCDIGFSQKIAGDHHVEFAYFRNTITDRIEPVFGSGPRNVSGESRAEGIELGLRGSFLDGALGYRAAWTHLRKSLSDHPRNAATASIDWRPTDKALVGIGATHLADHSWGGDPLESYTVARLYGSYQLTENVKLHARLENAFDERYELASFYGTVAEGSGRGLYAGITFDW